MSTYDRSSSGRSTRAQNQEYDDWPPPDDFRGIKLAMLGFFLVAVLGGGGWWAYRTMMPVDFRERALESLSEGDYRTAITDLNTVIQQAPDDAELRWLLGNAHLQLGENAYARDHLETALEMGYSRQSLLLALARAYLADGEDEAALMLVRQWSDAESAGGSAEWEVLRGRALLNLGKRSGAAQAFAAALQYDPANMEAKRGLAYTGINKEQSDVVAEAIETALARGLNQPETWVLKGELALSAGAYEQAVQAFEKAVQLGPGNVYAQSGLARAYLANNQLDAAEVPVRLLTLRFPADARGAYVRALYAQQRGQYELALDALKIVLNQDPNHALSVLLMGEVQLAMGNNEQALLNLSRFHRLDPASVMGRKKLAAAFMLNGQPGRAVEVLEPLLDQMHNDPELAVVLATAYARLGNERKARAYQTLSAKLDPEAAGTRSAAEKLDSDQAEEAIAALELALSANPGQLQSRTVQAVSHLRLGRLEEALAITIALAADRPDDAQVQYLHGTALELRQDTAAAARQYERALALNPDLHAAQLALARVEAAQGRVRQSRQRLEALLKRDSGNSTALVWLAQAAQRQGNPRQAINLLEQARSQDATALQPRLMLADIYLDARNSDNALAVGRELVTLAPGNPVGNYLLANALLLAGDPKAAVSILEALEKQRFDSLPLKWRLVEAYEAAGNTQAALDTVKRVLAVSEQDPRALVKLAMIERGRGNRKTARELAQRLKQHHPESGAGYSMLGQLALDEGDTRGAATLFELAFQLSNDSDTMSRWYSALQFSGQEERAEKEMSAWLLKNPNDSGARLAIAEQAALDRDFARVIEQYEWVTQRQPDNIEVLLLLAGAYREAGDWRALRTAQRALELAPANVQAMDTYAWLLVHKGQSERGAELLRELVQLAPKNPTFRYHLAVALSDSGAKSEAQAILAELLTSPVEFAELAEARELLDRLEP